MNPLFEGASISVCVARKRLLDDVNLSFDAGRTVALIGPNGAGKSTLLRVLAGELKPQFGDVRLQGRRLASYSAHALALHRAMLSQQINIAFPFTVADLAHMGVNPSAQFEN
jgi:iron complex transport system ATP-binding protein